MESRIPDGFREASGSSIHLNGPFRGFQMIQTEVRKIMKVQGDRTGWGWGVLKVPGKREGVCVRKDKVPEGQEV